MSNIGRYVECNTMVK